MMDFQIGDRVTYGFAQNGPMRRVPLNGRIVGWEEHKDGAGCPVERLYLVHADSFCEGTRPYQIAAADLQVEVK